MICFNYPSFGAEKPVLSNEASDASKHKQNLLCLYQYLKKTNKQTEQNKIKEMIRCQMKLFLNQNQWNSLLYDTFNRIKISESV